MARMKMPPDDQLMQWVEATETLKAAGYSSELRKNDDGKFGFLIDGVTVIDNIREHRQFDPVEAAQQYMRLAEQWDGIVGKYRSMISRFPYATLEEGNPDYEVSAQEDLFLYGGEATIASIRIPLLPDWVRDVDEALFFVHADGSYVSDETHPMSAFGKELTLVRRRLIRNISRYTGMWAEFAANSLPADKYKGFEAMADHYRKLLDR